ncbi:hybrid sensor histidine kinase/response regulator [Microvirga flavescens]|uniref:hybrid sensor histidine kinase/response regulator n=1 Tax=Microvirga flavescens TaxID=2249811 RepID=UPI000DDA7BB9|nr:hybrid sensor histidine kinase/response regulator [Microvirga flavescens]
MDDLLREFLTETGEHLDTVDVELVRFEQDPNNQTILANIFRLVHTIKGTCGFLGLPRLESLAHAAETLMGKFRDGMPVTTEAVTLILATLDRIKEILGELERLGTEPDGEDRDLIDRLEHMATEDAPVAQPAAAPHTAGTLSYQVLERELRPGEVSLDELERAFRETPGPGAPPAKPAPKVPALAPQPVTSETKPPEGAEAGESEAAVNKVQSIRVNVDTLEHLMTMVSELVLTRNQLLEISRRVDDQAYKVPLQRLSHVTAELQEGVMKTRMQPIGNAWQKLPRVVRDLSAELSKRIDLVMQGADTELDRQVLDVIKDPLTHMVRNSADHGIEAPLERKVAGKPERGTIRLNAYHEGGTITIEIADDGRGLNYAAIRKKAVERSVATEQEVERMSDAQIAKFIFHPGFSTAKAVTSVSGRGVGMDVVKTNIELIGGTVEIRSEQGRGTTFTIKIPLTLAIVAALIVSSKDQRFAIPQVAVLELVRVTPGSEHTIERINGTPVLRLRERLLPIVPLSKILGLGGEETADEGFVVVTQVGRQRFGILVDGVFHTEEIVVKPMSSKLRHIQLFSGNTILGDGAVVLIVDPNGLARMVGSGAGEGQQGDEAIESEDLIENDLTTLLVFRGGSESLKAVPLSLVTRLEEIDASTIEWLGGRPLVQYRGRLMPLVSADEALEIRREGIQALVVFSDGDLAMGLAVDEIVDIVDDTLAIELVADRSDLIGSAVIKGRATEIVNVAHYLPLVHEAWMRSTADTASVARSVLLVDGSAFFRDMLTPVLKASGYKVHAAASAAEALQLLAAGLHVDIVITDLDLPDRSGFDFVEVMRALPEAGDLPVIALAVKHDPRQIAQARKLHVTELVAKFDRRGLLSALAELNTPLEVAA